MISKILLKCNWIAETEC